MPYKLRFVQRFSQEGREQFLKIEKEFIKLEKENSAFPQGKRYLPITGKEPTNTLIWEAEFETLQTLNATFQTIISNDTHEQLLKEQIKFMQESYVEIYESIGE